MNSRMRCVTQTVPRPTGAVIRRSPDGFDVVSASSGPVTVQTSPSQTKPTPSSSRISPIGRGRYSRPSTMWNWPGSPSAVRGSSATRTSDRPPSGSTPWCRSPAATRACPACSSRPRASTSPACSSTPARSSPATPSSATAPSAMSPSSTLLKRLVHAPAV